jgi:hypothetical protein
MKIHYANIGKSIKVALAIREITNLSMAKHFNVLPQQVIRWKNTENHSIHRVQEFSDFFGMHLDDFIALGLRENAKS